MTDETFSRTEHRTWEMRYIRAVLEMHGFETDGCTRCIRNAVLPYQISSQSVSCINLYARFGGIHFHFTSTFLIQAATQVSSPSVFKAQV